MARNHEIIVKAGVRQAANWVIGGHENSIMDGLIEKMPSHESLAREIYQELMDLRGVEVAGGLIPLKKNIRFLTKEKIMGYIEDVLQKEKL